jgi:hypothetical protein
MRYVLPMAIGIVAVAVAVSFIRTRGHSVIPPLSAQAAPDDSTAHSDSGKAKDLSVEESAIESAFSAPDKKWENVETVTKMIADRAKAQRAAAKSLKTFHDFAFTDGLASSGIRFHHRIVDCAGRHYKASHYDHGNGVVIADVDGDDLLDIYFITQVGSNQLWRNLGNGRFEDITKSAGVGLSDPIGVTAAFADIDNDDDADLYVTTVRGGNVLYENDGKGHFTDITASAGLEYSGHSSAAVFFDYNRDGLLDLYLCNVGKYTTETILHVLDDSTTRKYESGEYSYYEGMKDAFAGQLKPKRFETSRMYKNLGNKRFSDVTKDLGLEDNNWTGDACPMDLNRDGWIDLYVLNMQGHDDYYENYKGESFIQRSREFFPATPWGAMGIQVLDYDNDGAFDIYITDMHSDMSECIEPDRETLKSDMQFPESFLDRGGIPSIYGNAFYRNTGSGKFEEISDKIGAENYWPWGLSAEDINADGYDDVFITSSMNFPFRYGLNALKLNNRGAGFVGVECIMGVEPRPDGRVFTPWYELDCSGADRDVPDCEGLFGRIEKKSPLGSRSSVVFDIDGDGDLDIVTCDFGSEPLVLLSNLSAKRDIHYLKLNLVGTKSCRDGLGAIVKIQTGTRTYTKVYDGLSGYMSHSLYPLYFGLDDADKVDTIEIIWPSGQVQVLDGPIEVNRLLTITEKAGGGETTQ